MRSLWRYIETLQPRKQLGLVAAFFLTLGFSLKEAASLANRSTKSGENGARMMNSRTIWLMKGNQPRMKAIPTVIRFILIIEAP